MKLFLKGTKCFTEKCPIERRNFVPGQHGKARPLPFGHPEQLVGAWHDMSALSLVHAEQTPGTYFTGTGW